VHGELVQDEKDYAAVLINDEDGESAFISENFRSIEFEETEHLHLDEFENENSGPEEKPAESVEKTPANNKGALNQRHQEYVAAPNEQSLNALLAETHRYAKRVLILGGYAQRVDLSEAAQLATIKVWRNLKNFHGRSKFSSWANSIIKNAAVDEIRKTERRYDVAIPDEEIFTGKQSRCHRGASGELDDNWEMIGGSRAPLPSVCMEAPSYALVDRTAIDAYLEDGEGGQLLDLLMESLSTQDTIIFHLSRNGCKPSGIGKFFKKNAKWASNQLTRIKKQLKKDAEALANSFKQTS
jgi:RNA polymerase sigma factor (sigma-70 family)